MQITITLNLTDAEIALLDRRVDYLNSRGINDGRTHMPFIREDAAGAILRRALEQQLYDQERATLQQTLEQELYNQQDN